MGRYRQYKNGIFGHRYNGLYVLKGESKGNFSVIDEDQKVIFSNLEDFEDCIWEIDKYTASEEDLVIAKELFEKEIYQLNAIYMDLWQKKKDGNIDPKDEMLLKWSEKVRNRKAEDKGF